MTDKETLKTSIDEPDPKFDYQDDPDYGRVFLKVLIGLIAVSITACTIGMCIALYGSWQLQLCTVIAILILTSYLYVRWKLKRF